MKLSGLLILMDANKFCCTCIRMGDSSFHLFVLVLMSALN